MLHNASPSATTPAVPVGVLKSKHPRSAIEFDPPLMPYKRAAIDTLGMGCENKIVLRFPHCFWNPTVPFFLTGERDGPRHCVDFHKLPSPLLLPTTDCLACLTLATNTPLLSSNRYH